MKRHVIFQICVFLLTLLWIYTSLSKLSDFELTLHQMESQVFGVSFAYFLAWFVPTAELIIALMLAFPKTQKFGLQISLLSLIFFTLYVAGGILKLYPKVPCSCGGVISKLGWKLHLVFNIFFVAISIISLKTYRERRPLTINTAAI